MRVVAELNDQQLVSFMLHIKNLTEEKFKQALLGTYATMIGTAKDKCPVRTGRLRSSINGKLEDLTIEVYARTNYAIYVELGTCKMEARPYLRPALQDGIRFLIEKLQRLIWEIGKKRYTIY